MADDLIYRPGVKGNDGFTKRHLDYFKRRIQNAFSVLLRLIMNKMTPRDLRVFFKI